MVKIVKYFSVLIVVLLFVKCSNPSTPEYDSYWIDFTFDGKNYHYEKGFYPDSSEFEEGTLSEDAYLVYYPREYRPYSKEQFVMIAFENTVTNITQVQNGISFGYWKEDDGWQWSLAVLDKEKGASQTKNTKIEVLHIDTSAVKGSTLVGSIDGEFMLSMGADSGKIVKNISYSVIRIN